MKSEKKLTCDQAKDIDMVAYLSGLGYEPARIRNINYWYLSPLRAERTPSFKINRRLNRWYDHGIGKGGNLIDFGILYHQCTVSGLLQILSGDLSFQKHDHQAVLHEATGTRIVIERNEPITAPALLQYLENRRIDMEVAHRWCREIHYRIDEKKYYAIGFKNDAGGYELRSPFFKGSTAPKDMTSINKGHYTVMVFEGFFDFLSYQTYVKCLNRYEENYVILNSLSFFEKARPFMEMHGQVLLCLDHDPAGQSFSYCAMNRSDKYADYSHFYKGYKDFNQWLVTVGYKDLPTDENTNRD